MMQYPVEKTDEEWRRTLTPQQYAVLRGHGTEAPGSCALLQEKRAGTFSCAGCGQALFATGRKFESGTGWPSFFAPLRSEEHTSELQSQSNLVCRLLLEKKNSKRRERV